MEFAIDSCVIPINLPNQRVRYTKNFFVRASKDTQCEECARVVADSYTVCLGREEPLPIRREDADEMTERYFIGDNSEIEVRVTVPNIFLVANRKLSNENFAEFNELLRAMYDSEYTA